MENHFSLDQSTGGTKRSDRIAGMVALASYLLLLLLLFLFVRFNALSDFEKINETSSGVLINFGNESPGYGEVVTRDEIAAADEPQEATAEEESVEDAANDAADDAVIETTAVEKPKQAVDPKPKKTTSEVKEKPKPAEPQKPVVNRGALYKKKTGTTTNSEKSGSHGSTYGANGKSGSPDGEIGAAGGGGTGSNFSLSGRLLLGALAEPQYDDRIEGRIVIEIQVNREGKVTSATFLPKNSTISSRTIIEAVRQAAMKTKFNVDNSAAFTQVGMITYVLNVR